jgi:hypothetical protein
MQGGCAVRGIQGEEDMQARGVVWCREKEGSTSGNSCYRDTSVPCQLHSWIMDGWGSGWSSPPRDRLFARKRLLRR